jgi:hypothetical protein
MDAVHGLPSSGIRRQTLKRKHRRQKNDEQIQSSAHIEN